MARRKGRKMTRRRKKQGISLINAAETVMLANVATQTLFNTNAYEFIVGNQAGMTARASMQYLLENYSKQIKQHILPVQWVALLKLSM